MASSTELNGLYCQNIDCDEPLRGRQKLYCSRRCAYACRMRKSRSLENVVKRGLELHLQRKRARGHKDEEMDKEKTCQNCGRIPCGKEFYFTCGRSDHNKDMKYRGQLLPPDYWIPMMRTERMKRGCHGCSNLRGTMLDVRTNKTVVVCTEHQIQKAPHPDEGCDNADYSSNPISNMNRRRKRLRVTDWR